MPSMLPVPWQLPAEWSAPSGQAPTCLKPGACGPEVEQLQRQLGAAGFEPGPEEGVFGPRTKAAVMAFQRARGLEVDGVVSARTWEALDTRRGGGLRPVLKRGESGPAVGVLQKVLATHGFEPGKVDGEFGPRTERAVLAFQRAKGLEADGIAGPKTWSALGMTAARAFPVPTDAVWRVWSGPQSERLHGPRSDFPPPQAG